MCKNNYKNVGFFCFLGGFGGFLFCFFKILFRQRALTKGEGERES